MINLKVYQVYILMKKILSLTIIVLSLCMAAKAQVGINILIPDSSAVLQLESNEKGLGLPRLTSTERDAITNPLHGLTIFNTQDSVIEYWSGECWLKVYQRNCNECDFVLTIDDPMDTLDRVVADSVFSTITVTQLAGLQDISLIYLAALPPGVSAYFNGPTTLDSSGTLDIIVKAELCSPVGGNYPFIIQGFCGDQIRFVTYNVYIRPPVQITLPVDQTDYNLQTVNSPILPSGSAQFVLLTINNGVQLHASAPTIPSYNTGTLDPTSLVCVVNNGAILARGGDGGGFGFNGSFLTVGGNPGENGGNAMNLTTRTVIVNNGAVYGGGGGGGSVGFALSTPSIPIIGSITIGFGFSGGGGSENGEGGTANSGGGLTIGLFQDGADATCCITSVPGAGAVASTTISIPISVASINITPSAFGGNGGAYAQSGTNGFIDVDLEACVSIPFIGNICIPIPIPGGFLPFNGPAGGTGGLAIKRNNNPLIGLPDGNFNSPQVKGAIAP